MQVSTLVFIASALLSGSVNAHGRRFDAHHTHRAHQARQQDSTVSVSLPTDVTYAPLSQLTMNNPSPSTMALSTTYQAGQQPTLAGAPPLPSATIITLGYPPQDQVPPTDSPQVQQWLKELDGWNIPDIRPTINGSCLDDPEAAANATAAGNCWWTCGQCSRPDDLTVCPDKYTWGVSYDDGPSPYTSKILEFLNEEDIKATFFVIGSRVPGRSDILQAEYMSGHMISVHTWSHPPLTTLTNAEIVAELGWTRQIIRDSIGVTPNSMRPPYGDIDDRVRAICLAMGLRPILWTSYGNENFDTDDWRIAGGDTNGTQCLANFEAIMTEAEQIDTGFIVLEHDLYAQSVDLAVGYILPYALEHIPKFTLDSISQCWALLASEAYVETATTSPFRARDGGLNNAGNNTSPWQCSGSSCTSAAGGYAATETGSLVGAPGQTGTPGSGSIGSGNSGSSGVKSGALSLAMAWVDRLLLLVGVMFGAVLLL
ncbi:glycoside hydrolase/deacetylase [Dacryopinax primogenitus]|uniref:chitin deacetylase n=1 Tax=Dacryopinax primogenitus (strain DJM 731) TaxID=1858805 RepID=M5G4L7_DACPD|nr:glycoside hydrolase/deacetylase [Dacryopinax primogenitus]EJU03634.1 glycoside hydrolase/deacetylase [Dacryopinax primogenitus]